MNFSRLTLFIVVTCFCFSSIKAQYTDIYTFEKGNHLIGANIGANVGNDNSTAYSAFYEYGLSKLFVDECTLGGGFFGGFYKNQLGKETKKIYIVGLKLNVHYQFVDRLDTYAGLAPNFNIQTYEIAKDKSKFDCYFHVGGRFYLTNWLGVFAEMSTGYSNFSGGINLKF